VLEQEVQAYQGIDVSALKPGLYNAVLSDRDQRTQAQWLSIQP